MTFSRCVRPENLSRYLEVLVHSPSCEDTRKACNGSSGGGNTLKKNLGGKWKKLVKKKTSQEAYTIPAELKDQLKQIYVY
ncbi:hypothetical protein WDU94_011022 [Cyamophila willieti]